MINVKDLHLTIVQLFFRNISQGELMNLSPKITGICLLLNITYKIPTTVRPFDLN
jgi:hypothetical protein